LNTGGTISRQKSNVLSFYLLGKLISRTYAATADYPKWFLRIVGRFKYGKKYEEKLLCSH
jgi:hypothetical protein